MPQFGSTISIAASPERIWSVLADVSRWPDWLPTVTAVEPLDSSALRIGGRYRVLQPKLGSAIWFVTELDPQRSFAWESRRPGVLTVAHHVITPVSADVTAVTLRIALSGLMGTLAGLFAGRLTQDYLAQESAALKHTAEARAADLSRA